MKEKMKKSKKLKIAKVCCFATSFAALALELAGLITFMCYNPVAKYKDSTVFKAQLDEFTQKTLDEVNNGTIDIVEGGKAVERFSSTKNVKNLIKASGDEKLKKDLKIESAANIVYIVSTACFWATWSARWILASAEKKAKKREEKEESFVVWPDFDSEPQDDYDAPSTKKEIDQSVGTEEFFQGPYIDR